MSKAEAIKIARIAELEEDSSLKFIQFKGLTLMSTPMTTGYVPLRSDEFSRLMYDRFRGISKSNIDDLMHQVRTTAPDRTDLARYVAFHDQIWDMRALDFTDETMEWVYASNIAPTPNTDAAWQFLLELANGDSDLAGDYLQALAPLFMERKPTGIVWFVGSGSNGKSSLINALYRIIGRHFVSMTTSAIEDGRDSPRLNGVLGNICRESSESRVEDTERYKAIGTHEPFTVHKFHSQDTVEIDTSFHTIFNANNVPVFSDKTRGARRRTLILPFPAHFADNPSFEDKTFTPEFLGGLVTLILEATHTIRDNGYRYKWSDATIKAKEAYDSEVNSAEAFVEYLEKSGVVGFFNFSVLKLNYENWCGQNGYVPLGITTLKRTVVNETGAERRSIRDNGKVVNRYHFAEVANEDLTWLDNGYGLRTVSSSEVLERSTSDSALRLSDEW